MGSPLLLLLLAWLTAVTKAQVFNLELAHMLQEDRLQRLQLWVSVPCVPTACASQLLQSSLTAAVAQPACLLPLPRALHGQMLRASKTTTAALTMASSRSSSRSDSCYRMTYRGKNHSTASPEPAPGVEVEAQTLLFCPNSPLLCPNSPPGQNGAMGAQAAHPGQPDACDHRKLGWWMALSSSSFSLCRIWVVPLTPEAGEWDAMSITSNGELPGQHGKGFAVSDQQTSCYMSKPEVWEARAGLPIPVQTKTSFSR